jgi:hypothetical protein
LGAFIQGKVIHEQVIAQMHKRCRIIVGKGLIEKGEGLGYLRHRHPVLPGIEGHGGGRLDDIANKIAE